MKSRYSISFLPPKATITRFGTTWVLLSALTIFMSTASPLPAANQALAQLFVHLNKAEVKYPGTEMRLAYELGGYTSPIMPKVSDH